MNFKQLLSLNIYSEHLDDQFFADLPGILENLVSLSIYGELIFESLEFLNGFKKLLSFSAKFRENEKNQQIIESIEERKNSLAYPMLPRTDRFELNNGCLRSTNFLRS